MASQFYPLSNRGISRAKEIYSSNSHFFPLIAAVLADAQKGRAFGNDADDPAVIYAEHAFGFAQFFGCPQGEFEKALEDYLLVNKAFATPKVRLYTPIVPYFFQNGAYPELRSERQRFRLDKGAFLSTQPDCGNAVVRTISMELMPQVAAVFPLTEYFWPNAKAFVENSLAQIAFVGERPVAICYAAAIADGKAEIDIFTLPEFRHQGYAACAGVAFINDCFARGIEPLWDCFTNNSGSLGVARLLGFHPAGVPYQFFTIPH